MASENVDVVGKRGVAVAKPLEDLSRRLPGADLLAGNYFNSGIVVAGIWLALEVLRQVHYPAVVAAALVLGRGNVVELDAVGVVRRVERVLIPLVARRVNVVGIGDPAWFAPPQHVEREIRVYRLCVRCELIARAPCDIGGLVTAAHYGRLRTGGGIDIRAHFELQMCDLKTIFCKDVVHYLPVGVRVFRLVVKQQAGGVVSAHHADSAVKHVFEGVGIAAVYHYVQRIRLRFCRLRTCGKYY